MALPFNTIPPNALSLPRPFEVAISDSQIREFRQLVHFSQIGPQTYESLQDKRTYGITRQWLVNAKQAWTELDWHAVEQKINAFPNFVHSIEHLGTVFDIHFVALFSQRPNAIPVLMLHGWPGSFLEFLPILTKLKQTYSPKTLPYHIVVPSLPGYAFSSAPPLDRDFRLEDAACILNKLMIQLGFGTGYAVQGGDVGSKIARVLGGFHEEAKAIHLNFSIMPDPGTVSEEKYNDLEKEGLKRAAWFKNLGSAYALEHATKPSTIGLALSTSPLALLAWIGEKFLDWTDHDPSLEDILESVTLYWLTNCFGTSLWPYRQLFTPGSMGAHENPAWYIEKPLGMSWFPKEIAPVPRSWTATTGNLVFFRQHQQGGHFAALERPDVLLKDLEDFLAQVWVPLLSESKN